MATFSYDPSFSAAEQSAPRNRVVQFGDGYEQRTQLGLQRDPKVWNLTFANRTDTERDNIITFLEDKKATASFTWTPPRGSAGQYVCAEWNLDLSVPNYSTITTTFRQVFEP